MTNKPQTLQAAIVYFSDRDTAHDYLVNLRWSDGVACPNCGGLEHSYTTTRKLWKCKSCKKQFSVKVGTVFEDSPIGRIPHTRGDEPNIPNTGNVMKRSQGSRRRGCTTERN